MQDIVPFRKSGHIYVSISPAYTHTHTHRARPSLLQYLSYAFNFHTFLAGPISTLKDHLVFMDGSYHMQPSDPKPKNVSYPVYAIVSKLVYALLCLAVFTVIDRNFSVDYLLGKTCRFYLIHCIQSSVSSIHLCRSQVYDILPFDAHHSVSGRNVNPFPILPWLDIGR